ncbi:hypothetical protein INT47_007991 [Mucor saturninus]|uniref:Uncharacterized protein n=1 Tax=Mucor saturninus TaxID=64648 RepID=A0A8H7QG06_9FUNG|nr:hypothetical protein INT47_007991 [Mucor saturninus]
MTSTIVKPNNKPVQHYLNNINNSKNVGDVYGPVRTTCLDHRTNSTGPMPSNKIGSVALRSFVLPVAIDRPNDPFSTYTLVDSGASASFINKEFAEYYNFDMEDIRDTVITCAEGTKVTSHKSTNIIMNLIGTDHTEEITLIAIPNLENTIVLGYNWLSQCDS